MEVGDCLFISSEALVQLAEVDKYSSFIGSEAGRQRRELTSAV